MHVIDLVENERTRIGKKAIRSTNQNDSYPCVVGDNAL